MTKIYLCFLSPVWLIPKLPVTSSKSSSFIWKLGTILSDDLASNISILVSLGFNSVLLSFTSSWYPWIVKRVYNYLQILIHINILSIIV